MSFKCISIDEAKALIDSSEVVLADIRDSSSYMALNIPNSFHITGDTVEKFMSGVNKNIPLIVYCYHGNSSKSAAHYFCENGFTQVYSMDGGFEAWRLKY